MTDTLELATKAPDLTLHIDSAGFDLDLPAKYGAVFTPVGFVTEYPLTQNEWYELGNELRLSQERSKLAYALNWGDWLAYAFSKDFELPYQACMEFTGEAYGTVKNWKWVAGKYPLEYRVIKNLTFSHYQRGLEIEEVEERATYLKLASDLGLSVSEMMNRYRDTLPVDSPEIIKPDPDEVNHDAITSMRDELHTLTVQYEAALREAEKQEKREQALYHRVIRARELLLGLQYEHPDLEGKLKPILEELNIDTS